MLCKLWVRSFTIDVNVKILSNIYAKVVLKRSFFVAFSCKQWLGLFANNSNS